MTARLALLLLPALAAGQTPEAMLKAAREVMTAAEYCFLVTVDDSGQPQARLMQQFPPTPDFTIWMGTNPRSRKVAQIRARPRTAVACSDTKGPAYLTLTGRARIVDDPAERLKHWRADWDIHYPGGPGGPNFVLIEFVPERLELISAAHQIGIAPASLRPPALVRRGKQWVAAE
jgi:general stress protein 26